MFEDATFESMGTIHTRSRNWMIATFGLNASVLVALIAIPLFHNSMLPQMEYIDQLIAPRARRGDQAGASAGACGGVAN
jgi:hypothetical protein